MLPLYNLTSNETSIPYYFAAKLLIFFLLYAFKMLPILGALPVWEWKITNENTR
jgi:hypothetical protein